MRSIVFLYSNGYFVKMGGLLYTSYQQVTALLIFFAVGSNTADVNHTVFSDVAVLLPTAHNKQIKLYSFQTK